MRALQRTSPGAFAEGIDAWMRGSTDLYAEAAATNVAALLILAGDYMSGGKWSGR